MDFKYKSKSELIGHVINSNIKPGDIILFHEDYPHTVEALPEIIEDLESRGFKFTLISKFI